MEPLGSPAAAAATIAFVLGVAIGYVVRVVQMNSRRPRFLRERGW